MNFQEKLSVAIDKNRSLLCVGLDSDYNLLPEKYKVAEHPQYAFNKYIIDETNQYVCSYKLNSAFYESRGANGIIDLKMTCDYLSTHYPDIPVIIDAKRGDIGSSNVAYADYIFNYLKADAVTVSPYLGKISLEPFLQYKNKGIIVLCKTSNGGSGELQDLVVGKERLFEKVARKVSKEWNQNNNCLLVVGATYPEDLKKVREIIGDMYILVPGVGTQGGSVQEILKVGRNSNNRGLIVTVSRDILFSQNVKKKIEEYSVLLRFPFISQKE